MALGRGNEAQNRECGDALSAPAFPDDAERGAVLNVEGDAIDRAQVASFGPEARDEIANAKKRHSCVGLFRHRLHAKLAAVRWPIGLCLVALTSGLGCAPRPRMCTASS